MGMLGCSYLAICQKSQLFTYVMAIIKIQVMSNVQIDSSKMKFDIVTDDQRYLKFFGR